MADLGRGVDMTRYYYAAEAVNLILICLLLAFHIFRSRHGDQQKSPKLFGILDLKSVSYVMLSWYIVRGITVLFTFLTNKEWRYLDASSCHFVAVFSITLIQFSRYNLHLFVAMRSRLSSFNETYSIWSKIGFLLMTSDLINLIFVWILPEWTLMDISPDGSQCVTLGYSIITIFWIIANDVIVSGYCLCVFILPLRKVITLEKQQENIENVKTKQTKPARSVSDIARRIMWCSLGALSTTAIACGIALTFGILQGITSPLLMFARCYFVVMQFSDIDINEIDENKKFWRALVIIFQWNQWKCCCIKKKDNVKNGGEITTKDMTSIQVCNSGSTVTTRTADTSSKPPSPISPTMSVEAPPIIR